MRTPALFLAVLLALALPTLASPTQVCQQGACSGTGASDTGGACGSTEGTDRHTRNASAETTSSAPSSTKGNKVYVENGCDDTNGQFQTYHRTWIRAGVILAPPGAPISVVADWTGGSQNNQPVCLVTVAATGVTTCPKVLDVTTLQPQPPYALNTLY